jgi:hypothetical protein
VPFAKCLRFFVASGHGNSVNRLELRISVAPGFETAIPELGIEDPVADRTAAGTARADMTRRLRADVPDDKAEVRPNAGKVTTLSASARSTGDFGHLLRTPHAICRCSRRPKVRAWPHNAGIRGMSAKG